MQNAFGKEHQDQMRADFLNYHSGFSGLNLQLSYPSFPGVQNPVACFVSRAIAFTTNVTPAALRPQVCGTMVVVMCNADARLQTSGSRPNESSPTPVQVVDHDFS